MIKNSAKISTIILVLIPLILVVMAGVYLFQGRSSQTETEAEATKPDVYADQTFDQASDPTEVPKCEENMSSFELIKDSPLLDRARLRIWIGGSFDGGLKIPKSCSGKEKGPFSIITNSGLIAAIENPDGSETSGLEWACGGQIPALKYLFKGDDNHGEGLFLVSGENAEQILRWHPAQETQSADSCTGADPDYQISHNLTYEIADLKLKYVVQKWKYKGSESEACKASVAGIDRLVLEQNSACERQLESQFNCEGLALDGNTDPDLGKIVGVLSIQNKTGSDEVENWLVFESPGYEWLAYSVVPIDNMGRLQKKRLKTLIYSGC